MLIFIFSFVSQFLFFVFCFFLFVYLSLFVSLSLQFINIQRRCHNSYCLHLFESGVNQMKFPIKTELKWMSTMPIVFAVPLFCVNWYYWSIFVLYSCCVFCDCCCLDYGNDDIYKQNFVFSFDCQFASHVNKITLESSKFLYNSCTIFANIDSVTLKITRNSIDFVVFVSVPFILFLISKILSSFRWIRLFVDLFGSVATLSNHFALEISL